MEKSLQLIDFTSTTDNRIAQVHDYNNVSMFKIDPGMKKLQRKLLPSLAPIILNYYLPSFSSTCP